MDIHIKSKINRLRPVAAPRSFIEGIDLDLAPGEFTVVTGRSECLLGNLFYIALGQLEPDEGQVVTHGDQPIAELLAGGVSVRGAPIAVVDFRTSPLHELSLVEHVAGATDDDLDEAATWLRAVGVDDAFHGYLPGAGSLGDIPEEREVLFGFDADTKRFFGFLHQRPDLVDEFLVGHRIPMEFFYVFRDLARGRRHDPAKLYIGREREMAERTRQEIVEASRAMSEAAYRSTLAAYSLVQRQETAWAYVLKLTEVARALASRPQWLYILDSFAVAGQKSLAPFYEDLIRWTIDGPGEGLPAPETRISTALFAPARLGPFDDLDASVIERSEDPNADFAKPRFSGVVPDASSDERGIEFRIRGLSHSYDGKTWIVRNIDLDFHPARTMVVMGGSGCGKSTILRLVAGLHVPSEGLILIGEQGFNGEAVKPDVERRKEMGVLFQDGALFQSMTVAENVAAPILEHTGLHPNVVDIMVGIKLDLVEMLEHKDKKPSQLSGGQKKRVGLARALALDPAAIFYDEPSAGLDPIVSRGVDELMNKLGEVLGVTSIIITHELESAFTIADRMVVLRKGEPALDEYWIAAQAVATGNPEDIKASVHPHVIEFLNEFSYQSDSALGRRPSWFRDPSESS